MFGAGYVGLLSAACLADFGHIGDGGVHFNLVVDRSHSEGSAPAFERAVRDWVYEVAVADYGGSFSAEHGIGPRNQMYYDTYTSPKNKALAAGLVGAASIVLFSFGF